MCWLREHHPEAVPAAYTSSGDDTVDGNTSVDPLSTNTSHSDEIGAGKENIVGVK